MEPAGPFPAPEFSLLTAVRLIVIMMRVVMVILCHHTQQSLSEEYPMATINYINGKWVARCGDNVVAEDQTEQGLLQQLDDLGIEVQR